MKKHFIESVKVVQDLKIRSVEKYNKLLNHCNVLNFESLKYMTGKKDNREILKFMLELDLKEVE